MKKKKTKRNRLTPAEKKKFKALLLEKRNEMLGDVTSMENETLRKTRSDLSVMPVHMADVGTDNYEQEFTLGLMDSEVKVLREIEYALQRLEEGTYGICEGTNKPIEKERLEAIPWARYCVAYAQLVEKGIAERQEQPDEPEGDYETDNEQG